jgi:hypothetical protein
MKQDIITLDRNTASIIVNDGRITHYVERYRTFARNTAQNIIGLGQTVAEASDTLTGTELNVFCEQVGIEPNGSTFRKLRKIGAQAERLSAHMESLPNNWTTVYALAHMDKDQFNQIVESSTLSPTVSMKEISEVLKGEKVAKDKLSIIVNIDAASPEQAFQLEQACNAIITDHGGTFRWSNIEKRNAWMNDLLEQRMAA